MITDTTEAIGDKTIINAKIFLVNFSFETYILDFK